MSHKRSIFRYRWTTLSVTGKTESGKNHEPYVEGCQSFHAHFPYSLCLPSISIPAYEIRLSLCRFSAAWRGCVNNSIKNTRCVWVKSALFEIKARAEEFIAYLATRKVPVSPPGNLGRSMTVGFSRFMTELSFSLPFSLPGRL